MSVVVDASVAVKWVTPETLSEHADRLLARDEALLAPDLLLVEAANALWKKAIRSEISPREAGRALELLRGSGVDLRPTSPLLARAMEVARLLNHPVYDCVYLALAERERATVVTADARLLQQARRRRLRISVVDLATF